MLVRKTFCSPVVFAALSLTAMATAEADAPAGSLEGIEPEEDEEEEKGPKLDDQGRAILEVTKGKTKGTFATTFPQSLSEASGDGFYKSEEAVLKAVQRDWFTRKKNAVRPGLEDAVKAGQDANAYAQRVADAYVPGRRGGFAPTVEADRIRNAQSVDEVLELLRQSGVNLVG